MVSIYLLCGVREMEVLCYIEAPLEIDDLFESLTYVHSVSTFELNEGAYPPLSCARLRIILPHLIFTSTPIAL